MRQIKRRKRAMAKGIRYRRLRKDITMKRICAGFYGDRFCGYTYGVNRSEYGGWTYWLDRDGFDGTSGDIIIRQDEFHVTSKREAVSAVDDEVKRRLVEAASR